MKMDYN